MAVQSVLVTVSSIGANAGLFSIYDNVTVGPLVTGLTITQLLIGYSVNADINATFITVVSDAPCNTSLTIPITYPPSPTPTKTPTPTPTKTPTPTPTVTKTPTPTPTVTKTPTPTPTVTKTPTPTPTVTKTQTPTPTVTPTLTPTKTPTQTPTPTKTPTPTPTTPCTTKWITWTGSTGGNFAGTNVSLNSTSSAYIPIMGVFQYNRLVCPDKNPNTNAQSISVATTYTYTFSQPVLNPLLAIYSLGNDAGTGTTVTMSANTPFSIYCNTVSNPLYQIAYNLPNQTLSGTEGYGIIQFSGSVTQIILTFNVEEYFAQLTWGLPCPSSTPI